MKQSTSIEDGYPYYAVKPLHTTYDPGYREYCARLQHTTPHTHKDGPTFASFEPPSTPVRLQCERLIALTPGLLPQRVQQREGGSYALCFATPEAHATAPAIFPAHEDFLVWLSQNPGARRQLQGEIDQLRQVDPSAYFAAVRRAVPGLSGPVRALLEEEVRQVIPVRESSASEERVAHSNGVTSWAPTRTDA